MESFLFQATFYLLAMVIAVPLATRAGLGSVLGYLIAGILIGPATGLSGAEMTDLQHFAEFGVVMMLFLIGLELEPRALWAMRDKLIGLGGLQVLVTMVLVTAIVMAMGEDFRVSLAIGMTLSLSSTAIVLQTLNEKRLMQTAGGRSSFAVLLTQDIAVIPMLALMPLLALPGARAVAKAGHGDHVVARLIDSLPAWGVTVITLAAVALTVLMGHYLVRPLFRFVQGARLREVNTAMALLIVVGIASLMNLVGLSPALGTFLAGVVLADSEFKHEMESDIEPFKGLLMGLFFITVGAGINFDVITAQPANIFALVFLLVALKSAVLYGLSVLFKIRGPDRSLFTLSLAQAGEFGFVLVSFAVGQRILPNALAEKLLVVIALSMLITPLLFILHEQIGLRLRKPPGPDPDAIDEQQPIIIAGVGRFGQVVNRLVTMSGMRTTVLDADLKTIQLMRTFGFKGYFGDPTRPDLLAAAGINQARVLVVALDGRENTTKLVAYARRIRPDLHIVARARDRTHVFDLYRAGANDIVREMFDSSLRAGRYVLENAGLSAFEASELEKLFFKLDRAAVRDLAQVWKPGVPVEQNPDYIARTKELNAELEAAMMEQFRRRGERDESDREAPGSEKTGPEA
ncbi:MULTISPECIES: monovalent cation:proton antiporter-2 (CPA2) family protein [unclassified Thioclava]|uniref:monovalent cation:proton antiporter-2 (CPA2) family protein n=1 Tax=unclassified Thioclava TaxID=2621713 RepID=UPI00099813EC|nr:MULTISPECIES: monovalent cation:proton antiporter-2 (CPA2) family protein [unclassified Thioclava]MPQ92971.1 potassium transporter [Thioclava sp. JE_KL1]OOY05840.1 potassium transporter [Thioclava sp. F28-4]OOY09968.1 potassium transporter [Thioclava sp. F36-7]OOY16757.1 potassium transporter [Thioclava sp. DLFJ4-1]